VEFGDVLIQQNKKDFQDLVFLNNYVPDRFCLVHKLIYLKQVQRLAFLMKGQQLNLTFPRKIVFQEWRKINVTFEREENAENTEAGIHAGI
jgi:hypothetical protein